MQVYSILKNISIQKFVKSNDMILSINLTSQILLCILNLGSPYDYALSAYRIGLVSISENL